MNRRRFDEHAKNSNLQVLFPNFNASSQPDIPSVSHYATYDSTRFKSPMAPRRVKKSHLALLTLTTPPLPGPQFLPLAELGHMTTCVNPQYVSSLHEISEDRSRTVSTPDDNKGSSGSSRATRSKSSERVDVNYFRPPHDLTRERDE